ncbi:hypothetical protein [Aliidiomarina indica]|uniref:hypothetical protein n=1 Tax=Aliidiomarina indica TaxID=2749147 RepID=UPI0018905CF5|nr:hypothetical protein [Aliidiomarina indica]
MHPRKNFKIRQYIASHSILRLTLDFIIVNAVLAMLLAIIIGFVIGDVQNTITYFYHIYTELFGKEPRWTLPDQFMYQNIRAFLATLSLLSPSIFLGIIIYKFFVLSRDNIVFRSKADVFEEGDDRYLNIHFYIASSLRLYNLRFSAFIRTYEKKREDNSEKLYPMNTFPLRLGQDSMYPLPYNYVPSRFRLRFKSPKVNFLKDGVIEVITKERTLRLDSKQGDFCELYIIARGQVPELQARFNEVKRYRLPEDISHEPLPQMCTRFIRDKNRFEVDNWQDFEPEKKRRGWLKSWRAKMRKRLYTKQAK